MKKLSKVLLALLLALTVAGCSAAPKEENPKYTEGTWSAEVDAMKGKMTVTVTTTAEAIESVEVEHVDTRVIATTAIDRITAAIVEGQTLAIDNVSGATVTSMAVKRGAEEALKQAGADIAALKTAEEKEVAVKDAETADIVIVGAGGAGLSAAIAAKNVNPDLNIVVLEKLAYIGGSTRVAGGVMWMRGTEYNTAAGIDFDPEYLIEFMEWRSEVEVNRPYVLNIGEQAADFANYLLENGVPLDTSTNSLGHSESKLFSMSPADSSGGNGGAQVADYLYEHAVSLGVDVRVDSNVTSLIIEEGTVKGVNVEAIDSTYSINAAKTILATGGFTRNESLIEIYAPEYTNNIPFTGAGSTGDGILMTEELDTVVVGTDMMDLRGMNHNLGYYGSIGGLVNHPSLIVNKEGVRFMNEKMYYSEIGIEINRQTDKTVYGVVDSQSTRIADLDQAVELGYAYKAETLDELADLAGIDKEAFLNTVKVNNETKANGNDAEFGTPNAKMVSIEAAPYYIIPIRPLFIGSIPGLKVTGEAEVVNSADTVIENLYACGELTFGNIFSKFYPASGSGVSCAVYSGAVAGEAAAEALSK